MSDLPTGTVTFLFTDIEGSTRFAQSHPGAWEVARARHDCILRDAIEAHRGSVFNVVGDAFCAAFHVAPDALEAALDAQRALAAEKWDETPIRVRMGIHTGAAEAREGDYNGYLTLARVQRIMSAAHGGQVVLSGAGAELAGGQLPAGATLRDMGHHRLKSLDQSEHLWQLVAVDLPSEFPPLRTPEADLHNLPAQATTFVGREKEMEEVKALLHRGRLVTLAGPGGTGKTRLALQVAAGLVHAYEHGVFFVPLAAITDSTLVAQAVAEAIGAREINGQSPTEAVKQFLAGKDLLLIIDNFEQVVDAGELVAGWLAAAPRVKVIVTSRTLLRVYGEYEYLVPPLETPDPTHLPALPVLARLPAVALFAERAQALQAGFALNADNAAAVARICARVDGLPLAIELAAARCRLLSPAALLERLEKRLDWLTGGARDLPARHRTLRAAIAWSFDLLDAPDQALFRELSVFAGGCSLDAAVALAEACGRDGGEALDGLASLVDKSLVRREEQPGDEPRFVMLETIREYACEQLEAAGETARMRRLHAELYAEWAGQLRANLSGADQALWLRRAESEHDNLRATLQWAAESGENLAGLQLADSLSSFWMTRGYLTEGRAWLERFLALSAGDRGANALDTRARALQGLGGLLRKQGDLGRAQAVYEEALELRREQGNTPGIATSLNTLGLIAQEQTNYLRAEALFEESLALRRDSAETRGTAVTLNNLGINAQHRGDYARARTVLDESLGLFRATGNVEGIAVVLNNLGETARDQGDLEAAIAFHSESLAHKRELGNTEGIAYSLNNLGELARFQGDFQRARNLAEEGLALFREIGHRPGVAVALCTLADIELAAEEFRQAASFYVDALELSHALGDRRVVAGCLEGLAAAASAGGDATRAARLFGSAAMLRESIHTPLAPADRAPFERRLAAVRAHLGGPAFDRAWQAGRESSLDEAVAEALGS